MTTVTIKIRIRKYLKEFVCHFKDSEGNLVYGSEPVRFSNKTRVGQLIAALRRKPTAKDNLDPDINDALFDTLTVRVNTSIHIPDDDLKTYLDPDSQSLVTKEIYNIFCAEAFAFVDDHLLYQRQSIPHRQPQLVKAYFAFMEEYDIRSISDDTIKRAYLRERKGRQQGEDVKKVKSPGYFAKAASATPLSCVR